MLRRFDAAVLAFEPDHQRAAFEGWLRFGKGRHPAALNFGDCASYATARLAGEALLFKGDHFGRTDVEVAAW